jgi:hypothetical protein
VLLGIRTAFREDSEFSLAEAVYGSQLVLPGQFINTAESPSPSFLRELQTTMTGRPPPPARQNTAPAPCALPEELLLACFILVRSHRCRRSTTAPTECWSGQLEKGDRTDKVSTRPGHQRTRSQQSRRAGVAPLRRRHLSARRHRTAGAAASGDLQSSSYNATNNLIHFFSIRPPASHRPAAEPTQPLSLPPQSLGGPVVAHHLFLLCFPPRPSRDLLYLTTCVHM